MSFHRWVAGVTIALVPAASMVEAFRKEGLNTNLLGTEQPHTHVELIREDGTPWSWAVRNSTFSGVAVQLYSWSSGVGP